MKEKTLFVAPIKPLLTYEVAKSIHSDEIHLHELIKLHEKHGGNPEIDGVVSVDVTDNSGKYPRYKLLFPDGFIDYVRIDHFDKYYKLTTKNDLKQGLEIFEPEEKSINFNITVNIKEGIDIEETIKEVSETIKYGLNKGVTRSFGNI